MSYTVVMLTFEQDGSIPSYWLEDFFPSPEAAFAAGRAELVAKAVRRGEGGFQIHDGNGPVYEVRGGTTHG